MLSNSLLIIIPILFAALAPSLAVDESPIHLVWLKNQTRFDFVFDYTNNTIKNNIEIEALSEKPYATSLLSCVGHHACLLVDGQFKVPYSLKENTPRKLGFESSGLCSKHSPRSCLESEIYLHKYCTTHWNPPAHRWQIDNNHVIEWHAPIFCQSKSVNHEKPCYSYDASGDLIDLTPWVQSDGTSYTVDLSLYNATSIKNFHLGICNEAHDACGPNVASCYNDGHGLIESGFNNYTSIKVDSSGTNLTYHGQYDEHCPDQKLKTIIKFQCKLLKANKGPKLVSHNSCESVIEWQTVHACPLSDFKTNTKKCSIKNEKYGLDIDLKAITKNRSKIEVNLDNNSSMVLGICQGITGLECGESHTSQTNACLKKGNKTEIAGLITRSDLLLVDDRLYMDSFVLNKTCDFALGPNFNATRRVGTSVQFVCGQNVDKPTFLGYKDCMYTFEWPTDEMCFESLDIPKHPADQIVSPPTKPAVVSSTTARPATPSTKLSDKDLKIDLSKESKSAAKAHEETKNEAKAIIDSSKISPIESSTPKQQQETHAGSSIPSGSPIEDSHEPSKMNGLHKFFMTGLILLCFVGFIVIIFMLDSRTRLGLSLSQVRRQTQPVPYRRVDNFNDLDL